MRSLSRRLAPIAPWASRGVVPGCARGTGSGGSRWALAASGRAHRASRCLELSTEIAGGQQGCWASGDAAGMRLQARPGLGPVGGISVTAPTARTASAGFSGGTERRAGTGQAGGGFDAVVVLPGDDERDAVSERLLAGWLAGWLAGAVAVWPPEKVRTSMLFRRRVPARRPDYGGVAARRWQA
jgi:hypothetical protein